MARTIRLDECTEIGYVHKTHGLNGDVLVKFPPLYLPTFEEAKQIFILIEGSLVPYFIEEDQVRFRSGETANMKFLWIDNSDDAKELVAKKIFVFQDDVLVDEDVFDSEAMLGFVVVDKNLGEVGKITEVNDYSGNLVISVDYKGEEIMIPLADEVLLNIDEEKELVEVNAPDGLFDLYE